MRSVDKKSGKGVPCDIEESPPSPLPSPSFGPTFNNQGVRSVDKKSGKEIPYDIEEKINFSVFPGLQVGIGNRFEANSGWAAVCVLLVVIFSC